MILYKGRKEMLNKQTKIVDCVCEVCVFHHPPFNIPSKKNIRNQR